MALLATVIGQLGMARKEALYEIQKEFDRLGPYLFAKRHQVLVDNSGEEFAIEFMTAFNTECYRAY